LTEDLKTSLKIKNYRKILKTKIGQRKIKLKKNAIFKVFPKELGKHSVSHKLVTKLYVTEVRNRLKESVIS